MLVQKKQVYNSVAIFLVFAVFLGRIISFNIGFVYIDFAEISAYAALVLILATASVGRKSSRILIPSIGHNSKFLISSFVFLLSCILSLTYTMYFNVSLKYAISFITCFVVSYIIYTGCSSRKYLRRVIFFYSAICCFISAAVVFSRLGVFFNSKVDYMLSNLFSGRNEMIYFILPSIGVFLSFIYTKSSRRAKYLNLVLALFITISILLSRGRFGSFVALSIWALALIPSAVKLQLRLAYVGFLGLSIIFFTLFIIYVFFPDITTRIFESSLIEASVGFGSVNARMIILEYGLLSSLQQPLFGHGGHTFSAMSSSFLPNIPHHTFPINPHNSYLDIAYGLGLAGLLPFILSIFSVVKIKSILSCDFYERVSLLPLISLLLFITAFDGANRFVIWFFIGISIANIEIQRKEGINNTRLRS